MGVVDVGNRNRLHRAEHQTTGQLLRRLVDARCAVALPRTDALQRDATERHRPEIVGRRIAHVGGNRVSSVTVDHFAESALDLAPCLVPFDLDVHTVALHQWLAQAIRVVVQLLQCAALRADVTVRKDVVHVATDSRNRTVLYGDLEAASCFTQRTGSVCRSVRRELIHGRHRPPNIHRPLVGSRCRETSLLLPRFSRHRRTRSHP